MTGWSYFICAQSIVREENTKLDVIKKRRKKVALTEAV